MAVTRSSTTDKNVNSDMEAISKARDQKTDIEKKLKQKWKSDPVAQTEDYEKWKRRQPEYLVADSNMDVADMNGFQSSGAALGDHGKDLLDEKQKLDDAFAETPTESNMPVETKGDMTIYRPAWTLKASSDVFDQIKGCGNACEFNKTTRFALSSTTSKSLTNQFSFYVPIPGFSWGNFGAGASAESTELEFKGTQLTATVKFGDVRALDVGPGLWYSDNGALPALLNMPNRIGRLSRRYVRNNPEVQKIVAYESKLRTIMKKYYGPDGLLTKRISKIIVGYKPYLFFKTDESHNKDTFSAKSAYLKADAFFSFVKGELSAGKESQSSEATTKNGGLEYADNTDQIYVIGLQYATFEDRCDTNPQGLVCDTPKKRKATKSRD